jgi:NAD(P)-dependent dehydrogenase (short-subunit alcohol dehydrogenase family)
MMTYRAKPADGVAWVTGASSGIGRGAALELARRGYRVHATARRRAELEALRDEAVGLKGSIVATPGDVTDRDQMAELVAEIERDRPIALALLKPAAIFGTRPAISGASASRRRWRSIFRASSTD